MVTGLIHKKNYEKKCLCLLRVCNESKTIKLEGALRIAPSGGPVVIHPAT